MNVETNYSGASYPNVAQDADALEKNVQEYPFSSLTRYLLLRKYKKTGHADFEKLLKKTTLYFNNPHWLQFQLSQIGTETKENTLRNESNFGTEPSENQGQRHFAVATDDELKTFQNPGEIPGEKENSPDTQSLGSHIEIYPQLETHKSELPDQNHIKSEGEEFIPESQTLGTHGPNTSVRHEIIQEEGTQLPHTQTLGTHVENNPAIEPGYKNEIDYKTHHDDEMHLPETESLGSHSEDITEREEPRQTESSSKLNEVIFADKLSDAESSDSIEPIAFEPLHTVDYFASQGIRITEEALTNDKLGAQMKSFTEWLKSMKKLHVSKLPEQNSLAEDIIQSSAEISNIDTEVLTEAMAEVLIKQDKKEKAIEMYNKLSLINPSKSAYFAAKIESIKST